MFHIQFFFTVWVEAFLFLKFSKYPKIGIMVSVKKLAQGNKNQSLELAVLPSLKTQKRQQIKYFKHICYLMDIRHYFHVFVYFMTCCSWEQNFRCSKFLQGATNKKCVELSFLQLKKLKKKRKSSKVFHILSSAGVVCWKNLPKNLSKVSSLSALSKQSECTI